MIPARFRGRKPSKLPAVIIGVLETTPQMDKETLAHYTGFSLRTLQLHLRAMVLAGTLECVWAGRMNKPMYRLKRVVKPE